MTVVDWASIVTGADDAYELARPADAADLERAQLVLGTRFPPLLRALYETTDGIFDAPGQWNLVRPIDVLIAENLRPTEMTAARVTSMSALATTGRGTRSALPGRARGRECKRERSDERVLRP